MKLSKLWMPVLAMALAFNVSCSDDEIVFAEPKGAYENGIIVGNEGNFTKSNADVSYIYPDLSKVENNIYSANNNEEKPGDVLQSIGFYGDHAYLVMNNSNIIQVVNRYTFKKQSTVSAEISQPRYIAFSKNKYYVTNSKGREKYVSVYNVADNNFVTKITLANTAERIVEAGGRIVVQNASFGTGNKLTFINPESNIIETEVAVEKGSIKKTISHAGHVYVISSDVNDSYIYKFSPTGTLTSTVALTGFKNGSNLAIDGNKMYFSSNYKVYAMDLNSTAAPTAPIITVANTGWSALYGMDVIDGKIFISDAKGFLEASEVAVYSTSGTLLKTLSTGLGSSNFYKN